MDSFVISLVKILAQDYYYYFKIAYGKKNTKFEYYYDQRF